MKSIEPKQKSKLFWYLKREENVQKEKKMRKKAKKKYVLPMNFYLLIYNLFKAEDLRKHLERVKFHLTNLEICMRLITNEQLDIKTVLNKLKEPIEMYVEALDPENDENPDELDPDGRGISWMFFQQV